MTYLHRDHRGENIALPTGKVVCVGRNYLQHVAELHNQVPDKPLLFMKPSTSLVALEMGVAVPRGLGECHNETEIALLIGQRLSADSDYPVEQAIWGYGLGLDLTLRQVQDELKKQGHPWERAKAFDGSCPISPFVPAELIAQPDALEFSLEVNGEMRQQGNSADMLFSIKRLLADIAQVFTLLPGDIVLTGTPKGVAALHAGDQLQVSFATFFTIATEVK